MTAIAEVKGEPGAKVRVFLDLGLQASFVSADLVDAIQAEKIKEEEAKVSAFGQNPLGSICSSSDCSCLRQMAARLRCLRGKGSDWA